MKSKTIWAALIIACALFTAGAAVAVSELLDFNKINEADAISGTSPDLTTPSDSSGSAPIQSFSADIDDIDDAAGTQLPMIVLIFGFTVIIAVINYSLREKED
ncbi:hypothetical protein MmiHf6_15810 [Methanimicrococcus hongohii]|uniref:Uncharacterized protein n=1 Tax=Methanimicrococcus hongohii TaxID=3028295 RepID=A0AA96V0P5_9EURY|nr:hypothetical protein [Methanimicrococcus sp. Hf6]WNY24251.1 hypothetical protein MmiHf6_15810 [Methanimicrococcus sp. Hf6]